MNIRLSKFLFGIMLLVGHTAAHAVNAYTAEYGVSRIVSANAVYPDFKQSPPLIDIHANATILVVITSTKDLKINAVKNFFSSDPAFKKANISFDGVKVSSDIAEQPVGLQNGIRGAFNRIKNAQALQQQIQTDAPAEIYYVSIENFFSELPPIGLPTDHALVMILDPAGNQYLYLSDGVQICRDIYETVITPGNISSDHTGTKSTIGDFLAFNYKVDPADWFGYVTESSYNRSQQIASAFRFAYSK